MSKKKKHEHDLISKDEIFEIANAASADPEIEKPADPMKDHPKFAKFKKPLGEK
jgi:hypothetical protein